MPLAPFSLATLLVQIAAILALARIMGVLFTRLRQPQVVGEIVAGVMLGPTLLGWVWPGGYAHLFPPGSLVPLTTLAQLGVILFLFLVGLEFDPKLVREKGGAAAAISVSGIALPFALGLGVTFVLRDLFDPAQQANLWVSALFMGAAMSITAFPILARVVNERNLQKTQVGGLAIAAAAVDDALAWTILALVVALVPEATGGHAVSPAVKLAFAGVYVAGMLLVVRPLLRRAERAFETRGTVTHGLLAALLLVALLSAWSTEEIGISGLFGAFFAGAVMPKGHRFVTAVAARMEQFCIVFFLPCFFALAGIKANLASAFTVEAIGATLLILACAVFGKLGGTGAAAWLTGLPARQALTIGVLMNMRALMELIILGEGLRLGVINERVYSMMVIMAIVTTAMASPLIDVLLPRARIRTREGDGHFGVLVPVARPESGGPLIQLAGHVAAGTIGQPSKLFALHLSRPTQAEVLRGAAASAVLAPAEVSELEPLLAAARGQNLDVEPLAYHSRDAASDIVRVARERDAELVLMGYHNPVFGRALLGGAVHRVMTGADCDVAVFVQRGESGSDPRRVLVPYVGAKHDRLALDLASRVARSTGAAVTVLHVTGASVDVEPPAGESWTVRAVAARPTPADAVLAEVDGHDLVVIGVAEEWGLESSLLGLRPERIAAECPASVLVVRKFERAT